MTFQFALYNGGPASMIYGAILVGFGATAVALSLAELASMYDSELSLHSPLSIADDFAVIPQSAPNTDGLRAWHRLETASSAYSKAGSLCSHG